METFTLQIHITGHCNCRCKHCYLEDNPSELSLEQLETIFIQYDKLMSLLRCRTGKEILPYVNITGGEPFMHKQIFDILDLMDAYSDVFSFRLLSNGTLFHEPLLERLERLNVLFIQLSLDGDETLHDALRGKGNFQLVIKGLEQLHAHAIPTKVSFTAHAGNYTAFSQVARVCRENHVDTLWSDRYVPCGNFSGLQTLTQQQAKEYVDLLQAERINPLNRQAKLQIFNRRSLQFLASGEYPYFCTAGQNSIAVDDKGNVYPCRRLAVKCGNVFENDLQEIYLNAPLFVSLRNATIPRQCVMCQHALFCRGGAKCLSYAILGHTEEKDPGCWL